MYEQLSRLIKKYHLAEFIKFVIVGVIATLLNYGIYLALLNIFNKNLAYSIGYALSFCFNLIASHLFTFKKAVNPKSSLKFALAHLINYLIQIGLLNLFTFIGVPKAYAPLPVYVIAIPVNYFVVRFALNYKRG